VRSVRGARAARLAARALAAGRGAARRPPGEAAAGRRNSGERPQWRWRWRRRRRRRCCCRGGLRRTEQRGELRVAARVAGPPADRLRESGGGGGGERLGGERLPPRDPPVDRMRGWLAVPVARRLHRSVEGAVGGQVRAGREGAASLGDEQGVPSRDALGSGGVGIGRRRLRRRKGRQGERRQRRQQWDERAADQAAGGGPARGVGGRLGGGAHAPELKLGRWRGSGG